MVGLEDGGDWPVYMFIAILHTSQENNVTRANLICRLQLWWRSWKALYHVNCIPCFLACMHARRRLGVHLLEWLALIVKNYSSLTNFPGKTLRALRDSPAISVAHLFSLSPNWITSCLVPVPMTETTRVEFRIIISRTSRLSSVSYAMLEEIQGYLFRALERGYTKS